MTDDAKQDDAKQAGEIKETDIVFDCPHCGKSLAIDYRGAGLTIPCTDCGNDVEVPIPEGMEIGDIDSSDEEQEQRIVNLRRSLSAAEFRIKQLESELIEMDSRRESLENIRTKNMYRFGTVLEKVGVVEKAMKQIVDALDKISEVCKEEK